MTDFYKTHFNGIDQSLKKSDAKMSRYIESRATRNFSHHFGPDDYIITASDGESKSIKLPNINDKEAIRDATEEAMEFVDSKGGTIGQINAARKMFTDNGYHITR